MLASIILIAAFAAWTYFASCFLPDSVYNLHVNRLRSALFRPVTGLQRTFPRLSERGAALALFCIVAAVCCLAVFLGGAAPQGAPHPGPGMSFGGGIAFLPMRAGSLPAAAFFVLGRFAILAGQLALVRAFVVWRHAGAPSDACEFFGVATWPLSSSRGWRVWNGGPGGAVVAKACAAIVAGT
ncbi:MAG: hypothetical protein IJS46_02270, partial [Kiritimatiellae bacterium]|nr:hypothetical protein [Kiritimatiellia bacterium]